MRRRLRGAVLPCGGTPLPRAGRTEPGAASAAVSQAQGAGAAVPDIVLEERGTGAAPRRIAALPSHPRVPRHKR